MKIESLQVGQVLYSVERHCAGNTRLKTTSVFIVRIVAVRDGYIEASWNGNPARRYYTVPGHWRTRKPVLIGGGMMGSMRLATREEIAAATSRTENASHFTIAGGL